MEDKNCFVIIGYGKKTSYANGKLRNLDLDETFSVLIKPVFESLGISCYRAIDKNLNASIDKVMLQEIKNADIAIADISTLNANVMWELGVRHSLKPHHTIMICEKEQMSSIPFDVNHFVVHQYTHSEEGIPYREVERFKTYLTSLVQKILAQKDIMSDSPVYTFLEDEMKKKQATDESVDEDSLVTILDKAEKAKGIKDFKTASELLAKAKKFALGNMTLRDNLSFIVCRQALCTYKSKDGGETQALLNAKQILDELNPGQSQDIEVLGISGAINKRLFEITDDSKYLDLAISFYGKGFQLKQDYYNGINTAFMLYKKASILGLESEEGEDTKLRADFTRNSVLEIAINRENEPDFLKSSDAVWVLLTLAEAYNYKKKDLKMKECEDKAEKLAKEKNDTFAMGSYHEQKEKIEKIFKNLN